MFMIYNQVNVNDKTIYRNNCKYFVVYGGGYNSVAKSFNIK